MTAKLNSEFIGFHQHEGKDDDWRSWINSKSIGVHPRNENRKPSSEDNYKNQISLIIYAVTIDLKVQKTTTLYTLK